MQTIIDLIKSIADFLWVYPLIILLFGTHIYLTIRLKFIQRYIFKAIKITFQKDKEAKGEISPFSSLTIALAATLGTGNIVGVSTAIAIGGPGVVLWMWLTGVFGISTKYGEAILAIKYRKVNPDGTISGGPMYALENGLGKRWLGVLFAISTLFTAFISMNMVQSNSISHMVLETYNIPMWATGLVLSILTTMVILGGIKSIARVCAVSVPIFALFYVLGCIYILLANYSSLPNTLNLIVTSAFTSMSAVGGFVGAGVMQAMRYGIARGLFSNESGLGSAPIIASAAKTKNSVRQALISSSGTFWDTVVVCALTGLVVVNSGSWDDGLSGAALTKSAFEQIPYIGTAVLTLGLLTFVFSTVLAWSYNGEKAIEYLIGKKSTLPFRIFWVVFALLGSLFSLNVLWNLADISNAFMAIPNLIALILLSSVIIKETDKYLWKNNLDAVDEDLISTSSKSKEKNL